MIDVVGTFGNAVSRLGARHPVAARRVLKVGWQAMNLKFRFAPDKRLVPAERYLARMMMDVMLKPLKDPSHSAIVSIFTPCELLQEVGLHPFNAEAFSSYLSASQVEGPLLSQMDERGISDTFCSYHKIFGGAALTGLLPSPRCIVHTNLICDANLVSFRSLSRFYRVPLFYLDVPVWQNDEAVSFVEGQLRDMAAWLEGITGSKIDEGRLRERVARSQETLSVYAEAQRLRATRDVSTDLVSPLYCAMTNNILLGTPEEERFVRMLRDDIARAAPKRAKHIYWMHTLPYWSRAVYRLLAFNEHAQICGDEIAEVAAVECDPRRPYEALARRCVYGAMNGPVDRRIAAGIAHARAAGADGAVWFNQWGCKHTIGASQLAKRSFEKAGIPLLVLDGDGCDRGHGGEEQTETRLQAFLEMLESDAGVEKR